MEKSTHWFIKYIVLGVILLTTAIVGWQAIVFGSAGSVLYLPLIINDEILPSSQEAIFRIEPDGGLNSSTFTPGSFVLSNVISNTQRITRIRIDLSTAMFPDMVYDPNGVAGDTIAKNLQVDSNSAVYTGHFFTDPHDGGFDGLEITFTSFDPGESFSFSLDVDPTSIKGVGAPGPNESGSVSGIELIGATITVNFDDGSSATSQLYRILISNRGSEALVRKGLPEAPTVEVLGGVVPPTIVSSPNQTIRVTGNPDRPVWLLVVEGGLFTDGVPGGGFDLDSFEANSALAMQEYSTTTDFSGIADFSITLGQSQAAGGLNYIVAVQENGFGMKGMVSEPIVLEFQAP